MLVFVSGSYLSAVQPASQTVGPAKIRQNGFMGFFVPLWSSCQQAFLKGHFPEHPFLHSRYRALSTSFSVT